MAKANYFLLTSLNSSEKGTFKGYISKIKELVKQNRLLCLQLANFLGFFLILHLFDDKSSQISYSYDRLNEYSTKTAFAHVNFASPEEVFKIPSQHGVVAVSEKWAESAGLQPTMSSPFQTDHKVYQISVFHQLHCVEMIWTRLNNPNATFEHSHTTEHSFSNSRHEDHVLHCVDWLRQAIMCNADMTLDPTEDLIAFGDQSQHKCKDFSAISDWAEKNKFKELGRYLKKSRPEFLVPEE